MKSRGWKHDEPYSICQCRLGPSMHSDASGLVLLRRMIDHLSNHFSHTKWLQVVFFFFLQLTNDWDDGYDW